MKSAPWIGALLALVPAAVLIPRAGAQAGDADVLCRRARDSRHGYGGEEVAVDLGKEHEEADRP